MKKYLLFSSLFLAMAFSNLAQDNTATLRYIDASNNKVEACIILSATEISSFNGINEKIGQTAIFTIVSNYNPEKKMGTFTFKSKSNANISDFEKLLFEGGITQVFYNNKIISSSKISENYRPVDRTETITNERLNKKQ